MNIEDMMADLRVGYVADLPNKVQVIEQALADKNHEEVRDGFHKLKGTGKTYGLPEISTLCAVMEKLCIEKNEQIDDFTPKGTQVITAIFEARKNEQAYDLGSDKNYQELIKLSES